MIEGNIERTAILSGTDSIAAFTEGGLIYRVQPIPIIQEISIYNLEKDRNKIVRLDDMLSHDYEIIGVTADIPEDDTDAQKKFEDPGYQPTVGLGIRVYSNAKAIQNISLQLTPFPSYANRLFINHRDTWHLKADRVVSRISFKCCPIYLEQPIAFA
jgi:hypothetical protein